MTTLTRSMELASRLRQLPPSPFRVDEAVGGWLDGMALREVRLCAAGRLPAAGAERRLWSALLGEPPPLALEAEVLEATAGEEIRVGLRVTLRLLDGEGPLASTSARWALLGERPEAVGLRPEATAAEALALGGGLGTLGRALAGVEAAAARPASWAAPLARLPSGDGWSLRALPLPEVLGRPEATVDLRLVGDGEQADVAEALRRAYADEGRPVAATLTYERGRGARFAVAYVGAYRVWRPDAG